MIMLSSAVLTNIRLEDNDAHFNATLKKDETKFRCIAKGSFGTSIAGYIKEGGCVSLTMGHDKNTNGENNVQCIEFGFDAMKGSAITAITALDRT